MTIRFQRICIIALILLLPAAYAPGNENRKAVSSWSDYRIISTRNIFSRNRLADNTSASSGTMKIPVQDIKEESCLILRGITKRADRFIAFIEDTRTNKVKQILKDEVIGSGKITDITIDFVAYNFEGRTVKVKTGMSMEGQAAGMTTAGSSGFGVTQQNYSSNLKMDAQAAPPDEESNAILQRLKERRKKELGE